MIARAYWVLARALTVTSNTLSAGRCPAGMSPTTSGKPGARWPQKPPQPHTLPVGSFLASITPVPCVSAATPSSPDRSAADRQSDSSTVWPWASGWFAGEQLPAIFHRIVGRGTARQPLKNAILQDTATGHVQFGPIQPHGCLPMPRRLLGRKRGRIGRLTSRKRQIPGYDRLRRVRHQRSWRATKRPSANGPATHGLARRPRPPAFEKGDVGHYLNRTRDVPQPDMTSAKNSLVCRRFISGVFAVLAKPVMPLIGFNQRDNLQSISS